MLQWKQHQYDSTAEMTSMHSLRQVNIAALDLDERLNRAVSTGRSMTLLNASIQGSIFQKVRNPGVHLFTVYQLTSTLRQNWEVVPPIFTGFMLARMDSMSSFCVSRSAVGSIERKPVACRRLYYPVCQLPRSTLFATTGLTWTGHVS